MYANERVYEALKEVARREGVPLEEVMQEISMCITEGMKNCRDRDDRQALEMWDAIPRQGRIPTPVELVAYLSGRVSSGE